ncbi:MAG: pyridoxamine 5'-phosphate oxidase family protein [Acidobacteria bacterium]|nr:pyridoxamine 5'-phosphate oxidase family protein [Acidobacteriota bacterium]
MIEVQEMTNREIDEVLLRVGYGHLACARDNQPYVVPVHYAYEKPNIYVYTTEGMKTDIIKTNPRICLQVEEVVANDDWRSVVVTGSAERISDRDEREAAIKLILAVNPTLTPAISIRWLDNWIRENREVVYRINPEIATGRSPVKVKIRATFAQPAGGKKPGIY